MSLVMKSENKYICVNKDILKEVMRAEGFIFKNSTLQKDEYYIDVEGKLLNKEACIRLRCTNNKELILSYSGVIESISSLDLKDNQKVLSDISQYDNIVAFLADLGLYKYVTINLLKETYVKKEREYYYSISIDSIENVGEFIDYDIYTESDDTQKSNAIFKEFESKLEECLGQKVENKYRDFAASAIYNNILKGDSLTKILVELEKVIYDDEKEALKNKYTILNLELIEKLEQLGIEVNVIYSNANKDVAEKLKQELSKIGYSPKFMNITDIKEIAVRETLILEKQKKYDFCEVALMIINNRK